MPSGVGFRSRDSLARQPRDLNSIAFCSVEDLVHFWSVVIVNHWAHVEISHAIPGASSQFYTW